MDEGKDQLASGLIQAGEGSILAADDLHRIVETLVQQLEGLLLFRYSPAGPVELGQPLNVPMQGLNLPLEGLVFPLQAGAFLLQESYDLGIHSGLLLS